MAKIVDHTLDFIAVSLLKCYVHVMFVCGKGSEINTLKTALISSVNMNYPLSNCAEILDNVSACSCLFIRVYSFSKAQLNSARFSGKPY